jgi:hypothetical protein
MKLRHVRLATVLGSLVALALPSLSTAQAPIQRQPSYSPYLNLTRPGNLANNYYGLVRPEIDFRNSINNLQQRYGALNQQNTNPNATETEFPGTGHSTAFMNYSHYYGLRSRTPTGGPGAFNYGPNQVFANGLSNQPFRR